MEFTKHSESQWLAFAGWLRKTLAAPLLTKHVWISLKMRGPIDHVVKRVEKMIDKFATTYMFAYCEAYVCELFVEMPKHSCGLCGRIQTWKRLNEERCRKI